MATGDYVVFCDADDFYEKDALEVFANAAKDKMPDLIVGGYREFRRAEILPEIKGRKMCMTGRYKDSKREMGRLYMELRKKGMITSPWAKAYRRVFLMENRLLFPDIRRCEDVVFNLDVFDKMTDVMIDEHILYDYHTPAGDACTRKFPVKMFDINKIVYTQTSEYLEQWGVSDEESKKYLNRLILKDVSVLLRLNFRNQWRLGRHERRILSKRMMNDETTVAACCTVPDGRMDQLIRFVVKSRSVALANVFSLGTIVYQKMRRKQK